MKNTTVAEKLDLLKKIQGIDSKLDSIIRVRGDLPEEVKDMEDEIEGYETRYKKLRAEKAELEDSIKAYKDAVKESEKKITKYEEQQMDVRNNREYDALTKEIELQQLEIKLAEKKSAEAYAKITTIDELLDETKLKLDDRKRDLSVKQEELDSIIKETEAEEKKLLKDRDKVAAKIEKRWLDYYNRLRATLSNGLAVVTVKRNAAEGCNITLPPQRLVEIMEKKKIIIDEYSGRILADVEIYEEPEKPKKKTTRTTRKKKTATAEE